MKALLIHPSFHSVCFFIVSGSLFERKKEESTAVSLSFCCAYIQDEVLFLLRNFPLQPKL